MQYIERVMNNKVIYGWIEHLAFGAWRWNLGPFSKELK